MNPSAPDWSTSSPYSDACLLDTSTTWQFRPASSSRLATSKPVVSGGLHVEEYDVRAQPDGLGNSLRPVGSLTDDVVPLALEQHPCRGAEEPMVIDDQHGGFHTSMVPARSATDQRANPESSSPE